MKKALMIASVASMIEQFNMSNIEILQNIGFKVDVAANFEFGSTYPKDRAIAFQKELCEKAIKTIQIDFDRNVFHAKNNFNAYRKIKRLIKENNYEIIHCHSPIGGALTRLAAKNAKHFQGKIIYTAHGFHFYKGAPLKNWLLYYPIERYLAKFTDCIITINKEDYAVAQKFLIKKDGRLIYIPGIGVNIEKIRSIRVDKVQKRAELGISKDAFIILNIGEMIERKNQELILRALAKININNIILLICGKGEKEEHLKRLAIQLGIEKKVFFAGFRNDINEILHAADLFVFPSYQEGLSVALMQAMAAGLPIICSNIRGNVDLIKNGENGYLINANDAEKLCDIMKILINDKDLLVSLSKKIVEQIEFFDINNIKIKMKKIYGVFSN